MAPNKILSFSNLVLLEVLYLKRPDDNSLIFFAPNLCPLMIFIMLLPMHVIIIPEIRRGYFPKEIQWLRYRRNCSYHGKAFEYSRNLLFDIFHFIFCVVGS